ncbi:MAG: glycosyltransferase [Saprospiraceae bacterium]|nr:glycosyltransferase [Saprospiraceae bacterium]
MKKIVILELARHFEVARAYTDICLAAGFEVHLMIPDTSSTYLLHLYAGEERVTSSLWNTSTKMEEFLNQCHPIFNSADLVICCTHENLNGELIHKSWNSLSLLVIHDANNYFDPWRYLNWAGGPLAWAKMAKYVYKGYFKKRKKSALAYDQLILPVQISASLQKKSFHPSISYLPFLWNEEVAQGSSEGQFHIVIPGTVNMRSRDYDFVLEVFEDLLKKDLNSDLTLTLLGKVQGKKEAAIIRALRSLQNTRFKVNIFEGLVDQQTFDDAMKTADLLFLPLQNEWVYGVVREIGGETCLSGNVGDMVRYGLPALLPESYTLPPELEDLVLRYPHAQVAYASKALQNFIQKKQAGTDRHSIINIMTACNEAQLNMLKDFK